MEENDGLLSQPCADGSLPVLTETHAPSAAVMPWVTWDNPIRYGKWRIYRNDFTAHPAWMTVAWEYVHEDYDGAPDAGDNRCGHGASVDACIAEIQEWEADHAEA